MLDFENRIGGRGRAILRVCIFPIWTDQRTGFAWERLPKSAFLHRVSGRNRSCGKRCGLCVTDWSENKNKCSQICKYYGSGILRKCWANARNEPMPVILHWISFFRVGLDTWVLARDRQNQRWSLASKGMGESSPQRQNWRLGGHSIWKVQTYHYCVASVQRVFIT